VVRLRGPRGRERSRGEGETMPGVSSPEPLKRKGCYLAYFHVGLFWRVFLPVRSTRSRAIHWGYLFEFG